VSSWEPLWQLAAWIGAALSLLLQGSFAVLFVAVSALSRVALHRVATEGGGELAWLDELREPRSTWRLAASLMHRLSLLASVLCVTLAARISGSRHAWLVGVAVATGGGLLLLELGLARLAALGDPRAALRATAWLVPPARSLLFPLVHPLHRLLERSRSEQTDDDDDDDEEEVAAYIEVGEREGILEAAEGKMMRGIVDLDETKVREIMTPRTDIVALPLSATVAEAREAVLGAGHSRLPVYRETIDHVVGVVHARDLLRAWKEGGSQEPVAAYLREPMFVPELLSAAELLSEMRMKTHMALVVDEYGGVAGLVTLEDLLEEIVGDIRDEHDEEEASLRQEPDGSWTIDAGAHVDELSELFGLAFDQRDFDTVGGLVVSRLGRVPAEGDKLRVDGVEIEVVRADRRRIRQVRVRPADGTQGTGSRP
jgi:CBS domain containing-hemolysin-like protein